jgi:Uma2 family endonuclease
MATALLTEYVEDSPHDFVPARFTVDEYFEMVSRNAFVGLGKVELLEGGLVRKMTKSPPHRVALGKTERILRRLVPSGWHVANQEPVRLQASAPEPDRAVICGEVEHYADRHPAANEVAIIIEIADESLRTDRRKARTYASEDIIEYWLVNISGRCVEVHRAPTFGTGPTAYQDRMVYSEGDSIPLSVAGTPCGTVSVSDLLP